MALLTNNTRIQDLPIKILSLKIAKDQEINRRYSNRHDHNIKN
jgi:hypothetical protein